MPTGGISKLEYAIGCLHMSSDISTIKSKTAIALDNSTKKYDTNKSS